MLRRKRIRPGSREWKRENLHYLIAQLDSIRAFKRTDLAPVEESFREVDRLDLWDEIQPDLEKIVYFPQTLPRVHQLMQASFVLRRLFPICFFSIILVVLIKARLIPVRISPMTSYFLFFGPFVILFAFIYVDLFIRRTIIRHERKHPNMQSKQKAHIKGIVERLIADLLEEVKRLSQKPPEHPMKLLFNDYQGTETLKQIRSGIFGRKYPTYLVVASVSESVAPCNSIRRNE